MISFMDGFSGYNQTKMDPFDDEKVALLTPTGNIHYTVMPLGIKNAGAAHNDCIFFHMLHDCLEGYLGDIDVKSKETSHTLMV